ncbi:MAG: hypothetical protein VYC33_02410, partial [Candidatus Thermoplasmatota archaeon]|nr:hypothetical protein [Candidatus Thermoplasmatota archaeon]
MGPWDKLSASSGSAREVVKSVFMFLIIAGIGPGLVFVGVSGLIDQGDEFSFWGDYYGPDSPEFAGEVIWEGTTDETWTSRLTTDPGEIRVWVEEGKTVDVSISTVSEDFGSWAYFERCDVSECNYYNNANGSIPGYEYIGQIDVWRNRTYEVQFTSTGDNTETTMIIVTKEEFPTPGFVLIVMTLAGTIVTCIAIFFAYYTTKEMREESKNNNGKKESVSKNNWIGPDVTVPSKLDKDFTTEPVSVIGLIAFSFFVVPGAVIFGGVGVWLLFFSIMNPYHEDGGLEGFVCMGIPLTLVGLFCFLLWWAGVIKERLRVQHSRDRLVYQATLLGRGLPPLRGLGLLSEKRRLSEAVYLETDKDGDDAMVHGRSSEG